MGILRLAASWEKTGEHPHVEIILTETGDSGLNLRPLDRFTAKVGHSVEDLVKEISEFGLSFTT